MPGVRAGLRVTADDVRRYLVSSGVQYPGNTVYKTMSRMSEAFDALERVDGGFRVRQESQPPGELPPLSQLGGLVGLGRSPSRDSCAALS
jgi:hypothetical protein